PDSQRGAGDAVDRSASRRSILSAFRRRLSHHVAAHLLGVWASGSLYRRDPCVCDPVGSDPGFLAQTDLWPRVCRGFDCDHRLFESAGLGPPHVYGRPRARCRSVLCRGERADRCANRCETVQLERHDGWGPCAIYHADAFLRRSAAAIPDRRTHGRSHAVAPLDWQNKNSYYPAEHFHNIFVGLIVFAILGGIYYWFPKMSGRMMSERIGKWVFWLMTIGFNLTFMIQHVLGLAGMPRRTFTYPDLPGWTWMNMVSTIGAFFMAAGSILFVWDLVISLFRGKPAGDNPWNAWTLEWATTSPPPHQNFNAPPLIHSRRPLWDYANPDRPDPVVPVGGAIDTFRPDKIKAGVITFIISEAGFFGVLILAYLFYNATSQSGPGAQQLDVLKTTIFSICLFASSFTIWRSEVGLRANDLGKMKAWLIATIVLGGIFIVGQGLEYWSLFQSGVTVGLDLFATTFFTLTGFHGLHVIFGLLALLVVLGVALVSNLKNGRFPALGAVGYYWHFVDVVWVLVFAIVYLWPLIR